MTAKEAQVHSLNAFKTLSASPGASSLRPAESQYYYGQCETQGALMVSATKNAAIKNAFN